jgi:MFS family permease
MPETPVPKPIDPRGPRFNQAMVTLLLLAGFVLDAQALVPAVGVVLLAGAALGPRWGPFLRLYGDLIGPRLAPPAELEDPRPPRFAAAVGVVFLTASTVAFLLGNAIVGWILALVVAVLAGLAAATGVCVGCEIWLFLARRRGTRLAA